MKSWVVPGIIAVGVLLILTSILWPKRDFETLGNKTVAQTLEVKGDVQVQGLDQIDRSVVKTKTPIKNLDLIITSNDSEAEFRIPELKSEFKVTENSEVLVEENDSESVILTIRQGEVIILDFGNTQNRFWIKKDGRQLTAIDYSLSNEKNTAYRQQNPKKLNVSEITSGSSSDLSQAKIEEILNSKKDDFFKCYGQLIQRKEGANGQILLSFEIMSIGKVASVQISKTEIQDPVFLSCLKEVVARLQFPKFSGENVTSFFPLKFE